MLVAPLLQQGAWRFDWRSALIGAVAAWLLAALLYRYRTALKNQVKRLWAPIVQWRARMRRSTEEKYLEALQDALGDLLLFQPRDPEAIFASPAFIAPRPPAFNVTEEDEEPAPRRVASRALLQGHPRVLLTGIKGDGRTTSLAMMAWAVATDEEEGSPYERFPLFVDLARLAAPPAEGTPPVEALTELSSRFLPRAVPKWLLEQLQDRPSVVLVDNWDRLPPEERGPVARWMVAAADELPESVWLVATSPHGYGPLVEGDFVPVEVVPPADEDALYTVYNGWTSLVESEEEELRGEAFFTLLWALKAGDRLLEITLRTLLHLRTESLPYRLTEVLGELLEIYLPIPDLGEEQILVAQDAQRLAFEVLERCAWSSYADEGPEERQLDQILEPLLPPEAERSPKLEGAVRKLLQKSKILRRDNKDIHFRHYAWRDYFAARAFGKREAAEVTPLLLEHLRDPDWTFLLECYAGLGKADALVRPLLKEAMAEGNLDALRRVARWATVAPEDAPWRKYVLQALAKVFVRGDLSLEERLDVARALALVAGESARPLYLQTLRNPNVDVRAASLRGLGWTGRPREMRILAAGLNVSEPEIQRHAVLALADLGTSGAFRFLTDALMRSDEELTMVIAETLARYPEGWEPLKEATHADDLMIRRAAAHGLGRVRQPWAQEILQTLSLEDPQWLVRSAAEAALIAQESGDEDTVVAPPPHPDAAQWLINWAARQGLGLGVGEAALQMLIRALEVGDAQVRVLAAQTLGQMGHRDHLEALRPLLEDENPDVREAALEAYERIERRYRGVAEESAEPQSEPEEELEA